MRGDVFSSTSGRAIGVASGGAQGTRPPLIEMPPMIKMSQKRLLFLQFQFLSASLRTTVIDNNIDPGGPGPSI